MDGYDDDEKLYQGLTGHPEYNLKPEVHLLLTEMDDSSEGGELRYKLYTSRSSDG